MAINYTLTIFMIIVLILLFVIMIFSAMSGAEIKKLSCSRDDEAVKAHRNTTISAILSGIAVVLILISIIIYIAVSRKGIAEDLANRFGSIHSSLSDYAQQSPSSGIPSI